MAPPPPPCGLEVLGDPGVSSPFHPSPYPEETQGLEAVGRAALLSHVKASVSPTREQSSGLSALLGVGLVKREERSDVGSVPSSLRRPRRRNARGSAGGSLLQLGSPAGHGHARGGGHRCGAGLAHVVALLVLSPETQRVDPAHSLLLAPPLHPSPAQLWPLPISHEKLGSPPPTPHPHPQQGKKLPSEAQMLTKNPCLHCQTPQKSIIDTRIYLPQTQQGTTKQLLWLQVSQVLETQKSGSSWGGSRPGGGKQLYTLEDAELSVL